jgi:sugar lactone lactonase YvrE
VKSLLVAIAVAGMAAVHADVNQTREAPNELRPSRILATFPANTFLENIIAAPSGDLYADSYPDGIVYRVKPDGTYAVFCRTGGKIAGIQAGPNNGFVVSGWSAEGKACVFEVASDGTVTKQVVLDGGMFPNGIELVGRNRYLIADSYAGLIWDFDLASHSAKIWLKDAAFGRANEKDGTPAINGIRKHGSYLYISNTNAHTFMRLKLDRKSNPTGPIETLATNVDFAIDGSGNVYATTHVLNSVQKLTPDGRLTTIAGLDQGLAGSTSAFFGTAKGQRNRLFVVTNGGLSMPPPGGAQPAKVVEIQIDR